MSDRPTCADCRHSEANRLRPYRVGSTLEWQARCLEDPSRASPPMRWHWESCARFAHDLREYPKEAA